MKIDSSTTPVPKSSKTIVKSESLQKSADKADAASANSQPINSRAKIEQWLGRAGISLPHSKGYDRDSFQRVTRRQHMRAQRRLENLESIFNLAIEYSLTQSSGEELDPDWFFNFIDMAENVHSKGMQELWGKILAFEISRPGSFSLRSLQTLQQLTHKDAQIFRQAASMACKQKGDYSPKLITGYHQKPGLLDFLGLKQIHQINLAEHGLAYPHLLALMDMGLIYSSEIETAEQDTSKTNEWRCGKESFRTSPRRRGLTLNYYKFTSTGSELYRLVQSKANAGYLAALVETLGSGFEVI